MKLTREQRDEILARYVAGEPIKVIAAAFGVTKAAVSKNARGRNLAMRRSAAARQRMAEAHTR